VTVEAPIKFKTGPKLGTLSATKMTAAIIPVRRMTRLIPNSKKYVTLKCSYDR
jgi:hypothetical protein